MKVIPKERRAH